MLRWSSEGKCDYEAKYLEFDSWVRHWGYSKTISVRIWNLAQYIMVIG